MTDAVESLDPDERSWYYDGDGTRRKKELTDEQMVDILRTQANWTTEYPWSQIADRLEELSVKV